MTIKELYEYASKHNMEDSILVYPTGEKEFEFVEKDYVLITEMNKQKYAFLNATKQDSLLAFMKEIDENV